MMTTTFSVRPRGLLLGAVVLLGGSVRASPFAAGVGRPIFDLPLEAGRSILDAWSDAVESLARDTGQPNLAVEVMVDRAMAAAAPAGRGRLRIRTDPLEYRGTGGVLRDVATAHDDDEVLLVGNASQVLVRPLAELVDGLAALRADVAVLSQRDGTPTGLFLVRCGALRDLPAAGFVDFKEQALPAIARTHAVAVLERERVALPVRNLSDYLAALRWHHRPAEQRAREADAFCERLASAFGFAEDGASVHPAATLHDSVVLAGGRVGAGAVLVRSLVCPGAAAGRGCIVDRVVTAGRNGRSRERN